MGRWSIVVKIISIWTLEMFALSDPEAEGNDITLAEFSVGEELRRSAVLAAFFLGSVNTISPT